MYQIVEYSDKDDNNNYVVLHGVTSNLERAKQCAKEIIGKMFHEDDYYISEIEIDDHFNLHVCGTVYQYTAVDKEKDEDQYTRDVVVAIVKCVKLK